VILSQVPVLSRSGHDRATLHRSSPSWLADAYERGLALVVTPTFAAPVVDGALALRPAAGLTGERYFLGVLADDTPEFAVRADADPTCARSGRRWGTGTPGCSPPRSRWPGGTTGTTTARCAGPRPR
jgi:hypothetical protein